VALWFQRQFFSATAAERNKLVKTGVA